MIIGLSPYWTNYINATDEKSWQDVKKEAYAKLYSKKIKDAKTPYKSSRYGHYVLRDLLLPFSAFFLLCNAIAKTIIIPFSYIFSAKKNSSQSDTKNNLQSAFLAWLGFVAALLASIPTLFFIMPYRLFLTAKHGFRKYEDDPKHRDLVKSLRKESEKKEPDVTQLVESSVLLMSKFQKANARGRADSIKNPQAVEKAYDKLAPLKLPATYSEASYKMLKQGIRKIELKPGIADLANAAENMGDAAADLATSLGKILNQPKVPSFEESFTKSKDGKTKYKIEIAKVPAFLALFENTIKEPDAKNTNRKTVKPV